MRRLWFSPVIAIVALFGFNVASAYAHDNSITASSVCTSQASGTWQASFTGTNDYHLSETMTFTGAVSASVGVGPYGSATRTVGGITASSATAGVYGVWSDGFKTGPPANHFATATRPPGCAPQLHQPTLQGSTSCTSVKAGTWSATYTGNAQGGTATPRLPVTHSGLTGASDSLTVVFSYSNGPNVTRTASVTRPANCQPVMHTPVIAGVSSCGTHGRWKATYVLVTSDSAIGRSVHFPVIRRGLRSKTNSLTVTFIYSNGPNETATATTSRKLGCSPPPPPPAVGRPHAQFFGPCLDPQYAVDMWDGVHATKDVTFIWHYEATSGNGTVGTPVSVRVKLRPGQHYRASFRRILGNSTMTVKTASGHLVDRLTVVPPGEYGACPVVS